MPKKKTPEPTKVETFLESHPALKSMQTEFYGHRNPFSNEFQHGQSFNDERGSRYIESLFPSDPDSLSLHGVESWLDMYAYIVHCFDFSMNYIYEGFADDIREYKRLKFEDYCNRSRRRKRKPPEGLTLED